MSLNSDIIVCVNVRNFKIPSFDKTVISCGALDHLCRETFTITFDEQGVVVVFTLVSPDGKMTSPPT